MDPSLTSLALLPGNTRPVELFMPPCVAVRVIIARARNRNGRSGGADLFRRVRPARGQPVFNIQFARDRKPEIARGASSRISRSLSLPLSLSCSLFCRRRSRNLYAN